MRRSKRPVGRSATSPTRTRSASEPSRLESVSGSRSSSSSSRRSASLVDEPLFLAEEELPEISATPTNPRSFPYSVKQQCWEKADKVRGRDSDRWRRDALGNVVFRKLVGCPGCLCHDYDHILPYSKGGMSTLENCQVLQATVNRSKGNRTEISKADLIQKSVYCRVSDRDMDLLELSAYGNVRRGQDTGGCKIQ